MSLPAFDLAAALNEEQVLAVTHGEGPQLVLAGAGSGKTRVITYRIAWLIRERGIDPWRIAAVTFTNKAAREMAERVEHLAGASSGVFVGTFHRFALRLLRRYGDRVGLSRDFSILDTTDQKNLVKEAIAAEGLSDTAFPPRMMLSKISAAKCRLRSPADIEEEADGFFDTRLAAVYRRYDALLRQAGGVDFDDLISKAVKLLVEHEDLGERMRQRLRYLMVDEFQDTNHAQLSLIHAVNGPGGNLTAVGDEDQSIYRWRGAELDNILRFEKSFPGAVVRKLERNYRSTQTILDASGALVAHNEGRRGKTLWTQGDAGEPLELYRAGDEGDEARYVVRTIKQWEETLRFRDMAILVRTNAQTRALEEELLRRQVPYCLVAGVRFYERAEVKDVVAFLRVIRNPRDSVSMRRILNRPPRGIGKGTQELLFKEAEEIGNSIWDVLAHDRLPGIPQRGAKALRSFRDLVLELRELGKHCDLADLVLQVLEKTGLAEAHDPSDSDGAARLENLQELVSAAQEFVEDFGHLGVPALASPEETGPPETGPPQTGPPASPRSVVDEAAQRLLSLEPPGQERAKSEPAPDDAAIPGAADPLTAFLDWVALVSDTDGLDTELGVSLMTLHAAKGLEFPAVVVVGLEDGVLPHFNAQETQADIEEERRLLYVGMTRSEQRLLLTTCRRRRIAGRYQDQLESPFLSEIPDDLMTVHESPDLFRSERTEGVYSFFGRGGNRPAVEDPMADTLRKGCRVRHATLGNGVILDLEGSGDDAKLTVFFERAGKKKLIARHATLEVV